MFELAIDRVLVRKIVSATTGLKLSHISDGKEALIPFEAINVKGEVRGCADLKTASIRLCYGRNGDHLLELFPASKGKRFDVTFNNNMLFYGMTFNGLKALLKLPPEVEKFVEEAYDTLH